MMADNESIRQQTGWFKGADGVWRFEIDDSKAVITHFDFVELSVFIIYVIKNVGNIMKM